MSQNLIGARPGVSRRACLRALSVPLIGTAPGLRAAPAALKVGFVYVSPIGEAGWSHQHELGRLQMQRALGSRIESRAVESVPEGPDAGRVLRDLAAQGHGLIFATSFGYLEPALRVAADFPQVRFEHAGGYRLAPNLGTYKGRDYEGRYLAGMVAGAATRSGTAGYVAAFPVPEVIQGINAFTLGLRAVNPQARVRVLWLDTWFDPAREREAAVSLVHQGADVLTNHSASPAVALAAQERGVALVGYQSDMRRFAPTMQLTAVLQQWGGFYTRTARAVLDGTWRSRAVWGGMADGFVTLAPFGAAVPEATRARVEQRQADIVSGRFHPFSGRLVDTDGRVRQAQGTMPDAAIETMDWFVQGVAARVPR